MTKQEYFALCARHDWFYDYSDDHSVYCRGRDSESNLVGLASNDPELQDIYNAWCKYMSNQSIKPKLENFQ